jgi:hypothetical protein
MQHMCIFHHIEYGKYGWKIGGENWMNDVWDENMDGDGDLDGNCGWNIDENVSSKFKAQGSTSIVQSLDGCMIEV